MVCLGPFEVSIRPQTAKSYQYYNKRRQQPDSGAIYELMEDRFQEGEPSYGKSASGEIDLARQMVEIDPGSYFGLDLGINEDFEYHGEEDIAFAIYVNKKWKE
jgi:hypothetical protein